MDVEATVGCHVLFGECSFQSRESVTYTRKDVMRFLLIRCRVCSLTGGPVKETLFEAFYQWQTKTTRRTDKRASVGAEQPVTELR